jgi:septin family protein
MAEKGIGVSNLPNLKHSSFIENGCTINLMVAGANGLGKTTFLNSFLGDGVLSYQPFESTQDKKYWYNEDQCNIQISTLKIVQNSFEINMNITEIDGIGDHINNSKSYEPICDLLEYNFNDFQQKFKESVRSLIDDKRIHVCFYFLEPLDVIKPTDLETMKKISVYCNVIPIVAKSDLLGTDETLRVKRAIRNELERNNIPFFETKEYESPFLISSGTKSGENTVDSERMYRWGTYQVESSPQNEMNKLKEMVLEKNTLSILEEAEHLYDNFRTAQMALFLTEKEPNASDKQILKKIENQNREIAELKERIKNRKAQLNSGILY